MNNKDSKIKTIVVTGVSSGIGKAIVDLLLSNNKNISVIGMGRNDNGIMNPNYRFIPVDLSNESSIESAIKTLSGFKIDVFISNAGIGYRGTIEDLKIDEIRKQFEVNYFGPIRLLQGIIPQMETQEGKIINIAALGSLITVPTFGYYNVSKLALSKTLEVLQKESGIQVSNIYLGAVKSDFGKNIVESIEIEKSKYKELYTEWQNRFKSFFSGRSKAEEVAELVESIIYNRSRAKFLTRRDRFIALSKALLPNKMHEKVINYYYKV